MSQELLDLFGMFKEYEIIIMLKCMSPIYE
jgi:hypothetical protein